MTWQAPRLTPAQLADYRRDGYVICYAMRATDILVVRFFHTRQDRRPAE